MAEEKCLPCRDICECITVNSPDNTILLTKTDCAWTFRVNQALLPAMENPADGSETKVIAGPGIGVTGTGTIANHYIVSNIGVLSINSQTGNVTIPIADGSETKVTVGTNLAIAGNGTTGSPYLITFTGTIPPTPTGAETKVTAGTGISVTGNGTTATPYIVANTGVTTVNGNTGAVTIPIADGSETKVQAGTNVTVTGVGTTLSPYIVNAAAGSNCAETIRPYVGAACCKSLDQAIVAVTGGGLLLYTGNDSCRIEAGIAPMISNTITYNTSGSGTGQYQFISSTNAGRLAMQVVTKAGIYTKIRGYLTYVAVTAPTVTKRLAFSGLLAPSGAVAYPVSLGSREWMIPAVIQNTGPAYNFILSTDGNGSWFIRGVAGVTYPASTTYELFMEGVIIEID